MYCYNYSIIESLNAHTREQRQGGPPRTSRRDLYPRVEVNDACSSILPANGGSEEDPYPGRQSRPESSATARFERPGIQGAGLKPLAGVEGAEPPGKFS